MHHLLFRQVAFEIIVPNTFSPDHGWGYDEGECQ